MGQDLRVRTSPDQEIDVTTPGPGGPQPPEQDPAQSGQPQGWGQQPPAGQPVPGQQFPGAQFPGQQPPAGQQPWGAPQPGGAQAFGQPQPAKTNRTWVPIVLGVVLVLAVIGLALTFLGGNSAEAGDCVNDAPDEIGVVDCDSDEAAFEVAGVLEDVSQNDMNGETICNEWPETVYIAWEGSDTDDLDAEGTGYCLTELGS
jgi:hypothetical protein